MKTNPEKQARATGLGNNFEINRLGNRSMVTGLGENSRHGVTYLGEQAVVTGLGELKEQAWGNSSMVTGFGNRLSIAGLG